MARSACCKLVSAVALIVVLAFIPAFAQTAPQLKYDKSTEAKVKGVVDEVKTAADKIVHLTLNTDKGPLDVVVAPEKFLQDMEITFAKGDNLEILGSQVSIDGTAVMLAREVTRNGDIMVMRDDKGKPVWVGWPK